MEEFSYSVCLVVFEWQIDDFIETLAVCPTFVMVRVRWVTVDIPTHPYLSLSESC